MSHKHLNTIDRGKIEACHELGYSCRFIGKLLNRHHGTIARELKRLGKSDLYIAESAQKD